MTDELIEALPRTSDAAYELKQKFEQTERPEAVEIINEIIGGLNNG